MRLYQQLLVSLLFLIFGWATPYAQDGTIYLSNPSFEDLPRHSHPPRSWTDCGFPGESPPDIQPDFTFQVTKAPVQGISYLGMVVRDNDTWESVSQQVSQPFDPNTCYEFRICLSRSTTYVSRSRSTDQEANYVTPIKLRIWAGYGPCDKRFLLGESPLVANTDWREYVLKLQTDAAYTHIVFEAFYKTPTLFPYNGNILLDRGSNITPIPCDTELPEGPQEIQPLAEVPNTTPRSPDPPQPNPTPVRPPSNEPTPTPPPTVTPEPEPTIAGVKRSDLSRGQTIQLENLEFEADSSRIVGESVVVLNEVFDFLSKNRDVSVEIGGHTNGWADRAYANKLSTDRAKAVANFLIRKGIARNRVSFRGYGKENPIDTNATPEGRRRNQRVEIKILELGG